MVHRCGVSPDLAETSFTCGAEPGQARQKLFLLLCTAEAVAVVAVHGCGVLGTAPAAD